MATFFAHIMRPAAVDMRHLRDASIQQAQTSAAADARRAEGSRQRDRLRALAWPTLTVIADGGQLSSAQVDEIRLTEAELRDSVRARSLSVPPIVEAARSARSRRGIEVIMLDDGGMEAVDQRVRAVFLELVGAWLDRTEEGTITVRVHPPGREVMGSIVVVRADGTSDRVEVDAAGSVHETPIGATESTLPPILGAEQ